MNSIRTPTNTPNCSKYLMEDFFYAGGLPAVHRQLLEGGVLRGDALTVNGKPIRENVKDAPCYNRDVLSTFTAPLKPAAGIAVLKGNIAPGGCVVSALIILPRGVGVKIGS